MVPCNNENITKDIGPMKMDLKWQNDHDDILHQPINQAVRDLTVQSQRMRRHFLNDPDALHVWDLFEKHVQTSFLNGLDRALTHPLETPFFFWQYSTLYEQLMKKKMQRQSIPWMLYRKFEAKMNNRFARGGALVASLAAAFAAGMIFQPYFREQQQAQGNDFLG